MIDCGDEVCDRTLTAATNVHRELRPGLLETVYEAAMMIELDRVGLRAARQVEILVNYRGAPLGVGFRADIIVEQCLLLELKAVKSLDDVHLAQVMTYLKILNFKRGYLLNFNVPLLKQGIKRVSI